jgi:hypothetical protein
MTRAAAFFDLDKTIIATSSATAFSRPFFAGGLITRRDVLRTAYAQFLFLLGGADADQTERLRAHLSAMVAGWDVAQVSSIVTPAGRAPSPTSVSSSTSHDSEAGSPATVSAPTPTAWRNSSSGGTPRPTTCTRARRGGPQRARSSTQSAPTRTNGAEDHPCIASALVRAIAGVTPAAAARRTRSASRTSSSLITSGEAVRTSMGSSVTAYRAPHDVADGSCAQPTSMPGCARQLSDRSAPSP